MHVHNRVVLMCSREVNISCYTSGNRHVTQVTNPVISHACGKDQEKSTTFGTYPWSFMRQTFHQAMVVTVILSK